MRNHEDPWKCPPFFRGDLLNSAVIENAKKSKMPCVFDIEEIKVTFAIVDDSAPFSAEQFEHIL